MIPIRIQKFLSEQGVASRRKAEEWITGGHVLVNGKAAKLGDKVDPDNQTVKAFGKIVKYDAEPPVYIAFNKPKGYMVTKADPRGRRIIYSLLPPEFKQKLWAVGRLDFNTEGLLILTNDGDLTQQLSHPSHESEKEYEVTLNKLPREGQLEKLRNGVELKAGTTHPAKVKVSNGKVYITIHEGKKRQIRLMFTVLGMIVTNLKRIRVHDLLLGDIPLGKYKTVTKEEIIKK